MDGLFLRKMASCSGRTLVNANRSLELTIQTVWKYIFYHFFFSFINPKNHDFSFLREIKSVLFCLLTSKTFLANFQIPKN